MLRLHEIRQVFFLSGSLFEALKLLTTFSMCRAVLATALKSLQSITNCEINSLVVYPSEPESQDWVTLDLILRFDHLLPTLSELPGFEGTQETHGLGVALLVIVTDDQESDGPVLTADNQPSNENYKQSN